jgi:DNA polymerase-3 subunit gamma/tau
LNLIKDQLKKIAASENITINDQALTIIAKKSDGAMRDAQSYFDQVVAFCGNEIDAVTVSKLLNIIDADVFFKISDAIIGKNFTPAFELIDLIHNNGWDFTDFLEGMIEHFRNILSVVVTEKTDLLETAEIYLTKYSEYLKSFSKSDLLRILNYLIKAQSDLKFSSNKKVKIEILVSHLIGLQNSTTISEIINELHQEHKIIQSDKKKTFNSEAVTSFSEPNLESNNSQPQNKVHNKMNSDSVPVNNWDKFVDEVCKEKTLVLGSLVRNLNPKKNEKNVIYLENIDQETKEILDFNRDYIESKLKSVYGPE